MQYVQEYDGADATKKIKIFFYTTIFLGGEGEG